MQNHGPFTIGSSARDAVKAAVMVEDAARTVHLARQGGAVIEIPQPAIDALFDRYQNVYGQVGTVRPPKTPRSTQQSSARKPSTTQSPTRRPGAAGAKASSS
jgi:L-ribulose-5-phosphate 4-epimerase